MDKPQQQLIGQNSAATLVYRSCRISLFSEHLIFFIVPMVTFAIIISPAQQVVLEEVSACLAD